MRRLASSPVLLLVATAYFVDLFLRWAPRHHTGEGTYIVSIGRVTGWETGPSASSGVTALGLMLVELAAVAGVWRSRSQRLVGFFLAAATAVLALGGLAHMRWGSYLRIGFGQFAFGAWIALGLGALM